MVLSGSIYPTANIFYPYILDVKIAINTHTFRKDDKGLKAMAMAMLDKFEKYWDSSYGQEQLYANGKEKRKEKNNVMVIASILDPRYKHRLVEYYFQEFYGMDKGMREVDDIKDEFFQLYANFEMQIRQQHGDNNEQ